MTFHDMFQKLVPAATQASRDSNVCGIFILNVRLQTFSAMIHHGLFTLSIILLTRHLLKTFLKKVNL